MHADPVTRATSAYHPPIDGWVGTRELPGYRAGNVVVKLDDLPGVAPDHFYFDLLLLGESGRVEDTHSGPCGALARQRSLDERSRFVRVVAELLRHAPADQRGLAAIGQVLSFVRERGVAADALVVAAQLLDDACSEGVLVASLNHLLELSLGKEEAQREMCDVVTKLVHAPQSGDINGGGLGSQLSYVVRTVGKAKARRYLREGTAFKLVPTPEMFGV